MMIYFLLGFMAGFSCGIVFLVSGAYVVTRQKSRRLSPSSSTLVISGDGKTRKHTVTQDVASPGRDDPTSSIVHAHEDVIAVLRQGGDRAPPDRGG